MKGLRSREFLSRCLVLIGVFAIGNGLAFAVNNCLQDEYSLVQKQSLNCTANDVRVAKVINTRNLDGTVRSTCSTGTFTFIADFLVQTTSSSSRSNVGLYLSDKDVSEQATALTGSCTDNIISPKVNPDATLHVCPGTGPGTPNAAIQCGSSGGAGPTVGSATNIGYPYYDELDPQVTTGSHPKSVPDNCGDSTSSDPTVCLGPPDPTTGNASVVACGPNNTAPPGGSVWPGTQVVTVEIPGFACPNAVSGTQLELPNCTSWQIPGGTIVCYSPPDGWPYEMAAIPGSPSKCNCGVVPLPIIVQTPSASVSKSCATAQSPVPAPPNPPNTSCTLSPEGGDVTYTIIVTNTSNTGDIAVDQVCDSVYGTVYRASGFSGPACATSGTISSGNTTCDATTLGDVDGTGKSCTFTVTQAENSVVSDTVSVYAHGLSSGGPISPDPANSNSVQVTSGEAPSSATVTKGLDSTPGACVTERFNVAVKNTGAYDEDINLNTLSDTYFNSITTTHGSGDGAVVGTTCGQSPNGLGTLSTATGGGALPASLASGGGTTTPANGATYNCQFDGQICRTHLDRVVTTAGTCTGGTCATGRTGSCSVNSDCDITCAGIQHTNKVTGTYSSAETGETSQDFTLPANFTETANSFTVKQCLPTPILSSTIP